MLRLIGRRLLLMIPTLILASMLIFALAEVLPGDVGRSILGPYATEEQVQLLNEKLGADRPLVVRYVAWAGGFVTGDWGESALLEVPVRPLVLDAFWNSLLLAGFALILIVPTSVALGVFAGLRRDSVLDRTITVSSLSMTVIPEFVSGVVLLYVFAVWLKWLPVSAMPPEGSPFYDTSVLPHPAGHPAHVPRAGVHRAHGPRGDRTGAVHAVHPHRRAQGPAASAASSSGTCCATPWSPPSPSSAARSAG